ncbi:MAG: hypothetical protein EXS64_00655 [Candidatus Latescibacteria bacterium]|nr:hypothetical protein [Candidatus Latescibacterota bacterium]
MSDDPLLLHVPFTDTLDAACAGGDGRGSVDPRGTEPLFEFDGLRRGARFGRDTCVHYRIEGNFNRLEGTVTLWFRPDWDSLSVSDLGRILWDLRIEHGSVVPDDPSQRWALVYPDPGGKGKACPEQRRRGGGRADSTFGCWRFCVETNRNRYVIGTKEPRQDPRTRQGVFGSQQDFQAGQWMHLAVSWTPEVGVIYVNGRLDTRAPIPEGLPSRPLPETMQVGAIASWINAGPGGVISDFRVYGTSLDEASIAGAMGEA